MPRSNAIRWRGPSVFPPRPSWRPDGRSRRGSRSWCRFRAAGTFPRCPARNVAPRPVVGTATAHWRCRTTTPTPRHPPERAVRLARPVVALPRHNSAAPVLGVTISPARAGISLRRNNFPGAVSRSSGVAVPVPSRGGIAWIWVSRWASGFLAAVPRSRTVRPAGGAVSPRRRSGAGRVGREPCGRW